jgi:hypothetical protein
MAPNLRLSGLALGLMALVPLRANAWCRTDTCEADPKKEGCAMVNGCLAGGTPLSWPKPCVGVSVSVAGSPLRGIGYEQAARIVSEAMNRWTSATCGTAPVGVSVRLMPAVTCDVVGFNSEGPNANVWMFRDDGWPYEAQGPETLALTTVTFHPKTGIIYDADVELNSAQNALNAADGSDLAAVVTHEAGHVLGLAHSNSELATMYAYYSAREATDPALSSDDIEALCNAYPPAAAAVSCSPEPHGGFTPLCGSAPGCSAVPLTRPARSGGWPLGTTNAVLAGAIPAVLLVLARRRRRR